MKWYWVIDNDNAVLNPLVTGQNDFHGIDPDALLQGSAVSEWDTAASLSVTKPADDGDPDDALQNHLGIFVFSPRLKQALQDSGIRTIQYLPVKVFRPNHNVVSGYCIANVIERRAALSRSQSVVDVLPDDYFLPQRRGKIVGIRMPVLKQSELENVDIFRLDEHRWSVYASEKFKRVFEGGGFTGLSFREVRLSDE